MKTFLIVTITCPDRPGIVERLTEVLVAHSANWEESRMARLGGDFAGIVKIGVPPENAETLANALRGLSAEQMTVVVKTTRPGASTAQTGCKLCDLRLTGADHEGIVHKVAAYLAGQGINVEAMETEVTPAPITGTPIFQMTARISVLPQLPLPDLAANLQRIAGELGVDIDVTHHL